MKKNYCKPLKRKFYASGRFCWLPFLKFCLLIAFAQPLFGLTPVHAQQLSVSVSQTGATANSCTRTLTAQVQGGSGNYSYSWSISTPGIPFPGPNNLQTIEVALDETTNFSVFVSDKSTSQTGSGSATVQRVLLGGFDTFIPNVFTPNGDGFNDVWEVLDSDIGFGAINVFYYRLIIRNLGGTILYQLEGTVSSGHLGVMGGDISWNGRVNGNGADVPVGTYPYSLRLKNCSNDSVINGTIDVFR